MDAAGSFVPKRFNGVQLGGFVCRIVPKEHTDRDGNANDLLPWVVFLFLTSVFFQMGFIWISVWFGLTAFLNMMVIRKPFFKMAGVELEPKEEIPEDEE